MACQILESTEFGQAIRQTILEIRPRIVLETGTHKGRGSTLTILNALKETFHPVDFYSMEINTDTYQMAVQFLRDKTPDNVTLKLFNGISVPRSMLPTPEQIQYRLSRRDMFGLTCKFDTRKFVHEVRHHEAVDDDILGQILIDHKPDLILLDSAGHMGYIEFRYLMHWMKDTSFMLMLDDVRSIKHIHTILHLIDNPSFEILKGTSRYCIAKYNAEV